MTRYLYLWSLLLLTVIGVGIFFLPDSVQEKERLSPQPPSVPGAFMEGIRMVEFRNDQRKWELTATRADFLPAEEFVALKEISLNIAGKPPTGSLAITAPDAHFQTGSKNLILPSGIAGKGENGMTFSARKASFVNLSSLLRATGNVRYADDSMQVTAQSMQFDTDTRNVRLEQGVETRINFRGIMP